MSTPNENTLAYVQVTQVAMEKAKAEMEKVAAEKAAVAKLIPQAIEAAIQFDRIDPADREKLASALGNPETALKLFIKMADPKRVVGGRAEPGEPTRGAQQKKAAVNSRGGGIHYLGSGRVQAAEEAFDRILFQQ